MTPIRAAAPGDRRGIGGARPGRRWWCRRRRRSEKFAITSTPPCAALDVAQTTIKVAEGTLLPTVAVQANAGRSVQSDPTVGTLGTDQASILGQINVPIYDGGTAASQTRQAKELASQSRMVLDQVRNQSRTAAVSAWV